MQSRRGFMGMLAALFGGLFGWKAAKAKEPEFYVGTVSDVEFFSRVDGADVSSIPNGVTITSWVRVPEHLVDKWLHVAVVRGRSTPQIYINGELAAETCEPMVHNRNLHQSEIFGLHNKGCGVTYDETDG